MRGPGFVCLMWSAGNVINNIVPQWGRLFSRKGSDAEDVLSEALCEHTVFGQPIVTSVG